MKRASSSKKALERYRRDRGSSNPQIKCKQCVAALEQAERDKAAARRKKEEETKNTTNNTSTNEEGSTEKRQCAGKCDSLLPKSAYNKNQWMKGEKKSRCRKCVEQSIQDETSSQTKNKQDKITAAKLKVQEANKSKDAKLIAAAESELAALEAEKVTGLKPIKLSVGMGRKRRGGRGRGR